MARTRANGEGSIYKRADGRYEGAVTLPTTSGTRKRIRFCTKTRQEAHAKLTQLIEDARRGRLPAADAMTVAEYLDYWLKHEKRRSLTWKRHESVVRLHLKPGLGRYKVDDLTVRLVQGFLDGLLDEGKTIPTIYQVRKVLSAALTYAMRQEMIHRNVARLVEMPRYKAREASHWTAEETTRFLAAARDDPHYAAFLLLALYGLRRGEVLGIRWCDVDVVHGVLRIRQQVQRINGVLQQVELKTDSSERDEPLLEAAREVLLEQQKQQRAARDMAGDAWHGAGDDQELVFTTGSGRPLESHNLARSFMRICKKEGLRRITLHGLRHSNATTQKELQVHSRDIQAILGHGDVRTTGIYEHVDLDSKRNALQRVEARLLAADGSARSRQNSRQTQFWACAFESETTTTKISTPGGMDTFLGGSSQIRTGDTRLFRTSEVTFVNAFTSIAERVRARARVWMLGAVAVNVAVKIALLDEQRGWGLDMNDHSGLNRAPALYRKDNHE